MRRKGAKSLRITNDIIVYLGNSRESTENLSELVREISKVAEYMLSIEKSKPFLYNYDNRLENMRQKIQFEVATTLQNTQG